MNPFERYYYQTLIQFDKYNSLNRNQLSLETDERILNLTLDALVNAGYLTKSDNIFELTEEGKNYLRQNDKNPEKKELWLLILEYLNKNKAFVQKIDAVTPFLHEAATQQQRIELSKVLTDLSNEGFIKFNDNDSYTNFGGRVGGRMCDVNQIGAKAIITETGRKLIEPPVIPQPSTVTTYNLHNSINPTIGDNNQSSIIADTITNNPIKINTIPKKMSTSGKILVGVVILVIGTLIVFFVEKLFN